MCFCLILWSFLCVFCFFVLRLYVFFFFLMLLVVFFFFFSSRRRHTRYIGDWSSDVCSSDLGLRWKLRAPGGRPLRRDARVRECYGKCRRNRLRVRRSRRGAIRRRPDRQSGARSEERRVGKECIYSSWTTPLKK